MSTLSGKQYSAAELHKLAAQAGWPADLLVTVVALIFQESQGWSGAYNASAAGPLTPDKKGHWGPAVGLLQIRSIVEEKGSGSDRDINRAYDALTNLQIGYRIYRERAARGKNGFSAWEGYTDGGYKKYLAASDRASKTGPPDTRLTAGQDVGGIDQPLAVGGIDTAIDVSLANGLSALKIDGVTDLQSGVTSARVSLSTSQVSQISVEFIGLDVLKAGVVKIGALSATFGEWLFRTAAVDVGPGSGKGKVTIDLRSAIAQNLKHPPYVGPQQWDQMSPSQVLALFAKHVVAQPSAMQSLVINGPEQGPDGTDKANSAQTYWDAAQSWADAQGYWLFESTGTLYFGTPSWLAATLPSATIRWTGKPSESLIEMPTFRITEDDKLDVAVTSVTIRVHWQLGMQFRPGMAVRVEGVGPTLGGLYIVTDVAGDLRSVEPWEISATTIIDPTPTVTVDTSSTPNGFDDGGESDFFNTENADFGDASSVQFPDTAFDPIAPSSSNLTGTQGLYGNPNTPSVSATHPSPDEPKPTGAGLGYNQRIQAGLPQVTVNLWNALRDRFKWAIVAYGAWGDAAHSKRKSDHNQGLAIDASPDTKATGDAIVQWAIANAATLHITYVIWYRTIYTRSNGFAAETYTGTDPHTGHVHISVARL